MELGTGIVVATVLAITSWQVEKRQAWRKVRNLAIGLAGLGVLVGLGIWATFAYEDHAREASERKVASDVRAGKLRTLAGVSLGDSRDRVVYAWGQPRREEGDLLFWNDAGAEKVVFLTKAGRVRVVLCGEGTSDYHYGCDSYAGLSIGDAEYEVTEKLGAPSLPSEFDGEEKTLFFGEKSGIDIVLKGDEIARFVLFEDRAGTKVARTKTPDRFGGVPVTDPNVLRQLNSTEIPEPPPGFVLEPQPESAETRGQ